MTPATICFPFVGTLLGGSHISACGLIKHLDRGRFEPLVLLQHPDSAIGRMLAGEAIGCECAPPTPELVHGKAIGPLAALRLIKAAPSLARYLRRRNVRIVHCNDGRTHATWALAARLAGVHLLWHHRGAPDAAGLRLAAPLLADRVVAVSKFAAPKPGLFSAARRTRVVHSPFDTSFTQDRAAARATLIEALGPGGSCTAATRFIAFSGALIDRKRPLLFVDTIAALREMAPGLDIRGIMLGEALGGMDARVRARAEAAGISGRIELPGFRTPGHLWLAACDVLLVPAVDEPFGRTLIEAMLVGTPVVATDSGGNPEAIRDGDTGLIVPPEDPVALAGAALSLLCDPARAGTIGDAARADAMARFGERQHAEAIMATYDEMIGGTRALRANEAAREHAEAGI